MLYPCRNIWNELVNKYQLVYLIKYMYEQNEQDKHVQQEHNCN